MYIGNNRYTRYNALGFNEEMRFRPRQPLLPIDEDGGMDNALEE